MRAGRLDRKITIQRKTTTQGADGHPRETWMPLAHKLWASYKPASGAERFAANQVVAGQTIEFEIRHSIALASLSPLDRVLYPAPESGAEQAPEANTVHDIIEVAEIGRRTGLRLMTVRKAESAP